MIECVTISEERAPHIHEAKKLHEGSCAFNGSFIKRFGVASRKLLVNTYAASNECT
jgi:hypothetical protein